MSDASDVTTATTVVETELGPVEYLDRGDGAPVLFVHGSPGGADQGALMGGFLVRAGFRVVAPSRPGYLATPLTDAVATPDRQAALELALLDHLGLDQVGVVCWSGGGPSTYRLVAQHPERVTALACLAAVSGPYSFPSGLAGLEERVLESRFGGWVMKELVRHRPKDVVGMIPAEEGDLTKEQAKALAEQIWDDPVQRDFVLALAGTVAGRHVGLRNDAAQFPAIGDLGLASITTPTLLVHGTVDTDVPPEHSERALGAIAGAEILRVADGTHVCTWTDPTSDEIQRRVAEHLRP
jgi:pimeloyl-ACP methyl ester carboxylesterase